MSDIDICSLDNKINFWIIILFQIGSPTALADDAAYEKIFKAAKASSYGLYVPAGAFWGGQDIQKMADRGTLKVYVSVFSSVQRVRVKDGAKYSNFYMCQ